MSIYIYIYIVYKNGKQILSKRQRKTPKKAQERCQNLSGKEKEKRQKMVKDRYKNLPEEKKQKLCECMKKYYSAHKK